MRLAPLTLSVCENGPVGGAHRTSCPFCGVRLAEGREPFLCADGSEESSCVPCSLVRHLERETIAEEAVLIWLPDLSQAALNALANGVHRRLAAEGALYLAACSLCRELKRDPEPSARSDSGDRDAAGGGRDAFRDVFAARARRGADACAAQPLCRPRKASRGLKALVAREVLRRWRGRLSAPDRRRRRRLTGRRFLTSTWRSFRC